MSRPVRDRGQVLLELLVASTCAALLSAGIVGMMTDSGWIGRRALLRMEAAALARACVEAIARDVGMAGRGFEGRGVVSSDTTLAVVAGGAELIRLVVPRGDSIEVTSLGRAEYRIAVAAPAIGTRVAAIGESLVAAPVGRVTGRRGRGAHRRLTIAWERQPPTVRALQPFRVREYALHADRTRRQLRRRDDDGAWWPVVDGIAALRLAYQPPLESDLGAAPQARWVTIRCTSQVDEARGEALARVRVGRP